MSTKDMLFSVYLIFIFMSVCFLFSPLLACKYVLAFERRTWQFIFFYNTMTEFIPFNPFKIKINTALDFVVTMIIILCRSSKNAALPFCPFLKWTKFKKKSWTCWRPYNDVSSLYENRSGLHNLTNYRSRFKNMTAPS